MMKSKINKWIMILIVISVIATFAVYKRLPENIPSHWNMAGKIDRYSDKVFVLVKAFIPMLVYLIFIIFTVIDPKNESLKKHKKAYNVFIGLAVLLLIMINWVAIIIALGYKINIYIFVNIVIGLLLIISGNFIRQVRLNFTLGIRTPWTISNETVWTRTHRMGSLVFIISGFIYIISAFINSTYLILLDILYFTLIFIYLYIYSYLVYRNLNKQ